MRSRSKGLVAAAGVTKDTGAISRTPLDDVARAMAPRVPDRRDEGKKGSAGAVATCGMGGSGNGKSKTVGYRGEQPAAEEEKLRDVLDSLEALERKSYKVKRRTPCLDLVEADEEEER